MPRPLFGFKKYFKKRKDDLQKLFVVSDKQRKKIWEKVSKNAGVLITSKVLRGCFSTEMVELDVADRFLDVFQRRAPRSVSAKHYTGKRLQRLKRIYEKANLKVLN